MSNNINTLKAPSDHKLMILSELSEGLMRIDTFVEALPLLEQSARKLFDADRLTVYRRDYRSSDIVSVVKSGNELEEIRVPVSLTSIAGFTAFSRKSVAIENVRDVSELRALHAGLRFNDRFDTQSGYQTETMMSLPLTHQNTLLGVLQLINTKRGYPFQDADLALANQFGLMIGQHFHHQLCATNAPYELLTKRNLISEEQLRLVQMNADINNLPIEQLLIEKHRIGKHHITQSLEAFYQVPAIGFNPERYTVHPITSKLNKGYLRTNRLVLLQDSTSDSVLVLIDDPNDTNRVLIIERFIGALETRLCVGLLEDIQRYLELGFETSTTTDDNLNTILSELETTNLDTLPLEEDEPRVSEQDSTVVRLVNRILQDGKRHRASDIHIEPGLPGQPAAVRMRIDGVCQQIIQIPATHVRATVSRIKIMSRLDIAERRLPQDGKFAVRLNGARQEVRVATIPTVNGEGVVLRLLHTGEPVSFDQLGLSDENRKRISQTMTRPNGLFLVVGPTGSGKTTSLHALIAQLNDSETKIWTAEDPVEITQPGLQQVQVQPSIGFTFAAALRSFLRADPDVILIGEMRDEETANVAVEASLTGHKVLSTLHTNSAAETITRLLELGVEPVSFADALLGILAQRLVRKLCNDCKVASEATESEVSYLRNQYGSGFDTEVALRPGDTVYRAKGCDCCNHTGYLGRVAIHELLTGSAELRELIHQRASADKIRALAANAGTRTLLQDGIQKIAKGVIDLDQLHRVAATT